MPQTLAQLKASSPAYAAMDDMEFASKVYRKYYADKMSFPEFAGKVGFDPYAKDDPTQGMSRADQFLAGMGKSFVDTGHGVRQLATEAAGLFSDGAKAQAQQLRKQETARARTDAPLMQRGAGVAGNIAGTLAQIATPGVALKGAGLAGQALLPTTLAGNVGQGIALGLMQPVGEGDSRTENAAVSGLLSGGGYAATALPSWMIRKGASLSPSFTNAMQERQAAQVIRDFAADPSRLANVQPSQIVPGSMPTLAETTGDIGLAGLERTMGNLPDFGPQLAIRRGANNTARVAAIEGAFNGADPATASAIRQQANKRAGAMLRPVDNVPLATTQPLKDAIDKLLVKNRAKPAAREVLGFIRGELDNVQTVGDAHGLRQTIGELMGGKLEGKANGKLAQFQLGTVRNLLDRQMKQAYPEWSDFLKGHRAMMKEADQVGIGADLLATGRAVRDATNDPVLTPSAFARMANKVDAPKTRTDRLRFAALTDEQRGTIDAVRRDLERQSRAMNDGRAVGSNTVQNAIGGNTLQGAVGPVGAAMIDPTGGVAMLAINQLRKTYGERTMSAVQDVMLNPERANDILGKLPSKQREAVMSAIRQLPRYSGLAARGATPLAVGE